MWCFEENSKQIGDWLIDVSENEDFSNTEYNFEFTATDDVIIIYQLHVVEELSDASPQVLNKL